MTRVIAYHDTRGADRSHPTFSDVVIAGIAPGGGLYVPDEIPTLDLDAILSYARQPYWSRASDLFARFGVDVDPLRVEALMRHAYGTQWSDPRIAPVTEVAPGTHVLELWHGPTSAFKDMALQCMPLFFSEAIAARRAEGLLAEEYLILVATSGDTGKAALEGFADRPHTKIAVFYPADGVSSLQRRQMVTQTGANVLVIGVRGNFDDCQNAVKAAFRNTRFRSELRERHRLLLSSANSINWGRLLPQIVYYASAYADLVASRAVEPGAQIDVCVPTGNFGNILGAYYAKRAGVPIDRLICASNENKVLTEFITTSVYDISARSFVVTPSPSMDILISSNLERQLYELTRDPVRTAEWMSALRDDGRFTVDRETFALVREHFAADSVTNDETLACIRRVWRDHGCLLDPHTAVAWEVADRMRGENPLVVVSTAHWAKFGVDVYKALCGIAYSERLPDDARRLSDSELLSAIQRLAPTSPRVPSNLAALDGVPERFDRVIGALDEGVESAVREWLSPRA